MKFVPNGVTRKVSMTMLKTQKHSPALLFAAGVVGIGATVVLACRATLQLEDVLVESEKDLANIDEIALKNKTVDVRREKAYVYGRVAGKLIRLYGPAVVIGAASVGSLTGSHYILSRRNNALTAAYIAVDKAFTAYRGRVVDEYGEDKDRELFFGVSEREIAVDTKNGTKVEVVRAAAGESRYAMFFGEDNRNWVHTPEYNISFFRNKQNWLNDMLKADGYVMLNDAYKELGFDPTTAGQQVGWVWDPKGLLEDGVVRDNHIDFGIFKDENMDSLHDFMTGREGSIVIDFNVDGPIYDLIDTINKNKKKARGY